MISISVVGQIVGSGEQRDEAGVIVEVRSKRLLRVTLMSLKAGFGTNSGKVFKNFVNVQVYGNKIEEILAGIMIGDWVEVTGDPRVDVWTGDDKKAHGRIVVVTTQITQCVFVAPEEEPRQSKEDAPF